MCLQLLRTKLRFYASIPFPSIYNQSIPIYLSIGIGNRYQSITTRIFAIDWWSIININRLIDIYWYRLISIVIDYRLDTPVTRHCNRNQSTSRTTSKHSGMLLYSGSTKKLEPMQQSGRTYYVPKRVITLAMSCSWVTNREKKKEKKIMKCGPPRLVLKQKYQGYEVKRYNHNWHIRGMVPRLRSRSQGAGRKKE